MAFVYAVRMQGIFQSVVRRSLIPSLDSVILSAALNPQIIFRNQIVINKALFDAMLQVG